MFEKGKTYTYDEIEEKVKNGTTRAITKFVDDYKKKDNSENLTLVSLLGLVCGCSIMLELFSEKKEGEKD